MRVERRYLHDINLVNNRLLNPVINPVTTVQRIALSGLLTTGDEGYLAYDTNLSSFYFWDGSAWQQVGGSTSWGTITGTITAQTDLITYLSTNYYPLSSNPAGYLTAAAANLLYYPLSSNPAGYLTSAALAPYLTTALAASTYVPLTRNITINGTTYDLSADRTWTVTGLPSQTGNNGYFLTTDGTNASWVAITPGGVTSVGASAPLASSGGATPNITITQASGSTNGYLSSTDWTTFNSKEPAIAAGTTAQYWRGDKTWQTFPTIPTVTPSALTKTDDTNVTLTLGGTPSTALLQAVSLTLGWTGTLADSRIASAATWNGKQTAYANLSTIGGLANSAGYLYNDGSGVFSYTTPTGGGTVTSVSAGTGMSFTTITTSGSVAIDTAKVPYFSGNLSGTPSASNFLRGDGAWTTVTGGVSRSINTVSGNTTAGATANTDYYYFVSAAATITLPTAVGKLMNIQ